MAFDPNQVDLKLINELYGDKKNYYTQELKKPKRHPRVVPILTQKEILEFAERANTKKKVDTDK